MAHKMMPVALHKSNWTVRRTRQVGKSETTAGMLRKPADNKKDMQDFLRRKR